MKRRVLIGLSVVVALALFFVARDMAKQRPELVYKSKEFRDIFWVSPQGRWMLCDKTRSGEKVLVDLRANRQSRLPLSGRFLRYTPDESAVLTGSPTAIELHQLPAGQRKQSFALPANFEVNDVHFSEKGVLTAVNETSIARWNVGTGALMDSRVYNPNPRPMWACGTLADYLFASAAPTGFAGLNSDGTCVRSGNGFFSVADGQPMSAPSEASRYPKPRADVNIESGGKILCITDKRSGQKLFSQNSIRHQFTADGNWLLNVKDEGHIQLVNARNWKIAKERNFSSAYDWDWAGAPEFVLTTDARGRVWRWNLR